MTVNNNAPEDIVSTKINIGSSPDLYNFSHCGFNEVTAMVRAIAVVFALTVGSPALAAVIDAQNFDHIPGDQVAATTEDSFIGFGVLTNRGSYNDGVGLNSFQTSWVDTRGYINAGPTDDARRDEFDWIGVFGWDQNTTGDGFPDIGADGRPYGSDQNHSYTIGGPDGAVTVDFLTVDVRGYVNVTLSLSYHINLGDGWGGGPNRFQVAVNGDERLSMDSADLNAAASPGAADQVVWHTFTTDLDGLDAVALSVMLEAGGLNKKRIWFDDIVISGDLAPGGPGGGIPSIPAPFTLPLLASGLGLLLLRRRR